MDLLFLNIGAQEMILIMILTSLTFIPTILIIVSILDILKRQFKNNSDKVLMVVLIFFFTHYRFLPTTLFATTQPSLN